MFFKKFKNFIKSNLVIQTPKILNLEKSIIYKKYNNNSNNILSMGKMNPDKIFYIIKRTPGTGLFSNVLFVLNHLIKAKKLGYIPFVDMQNFHTIYNEKNPIKNNENAWEYYFKNLSNYTLSEIYNSKRVIFTSNEFEQDFEKDLISEEIKDKFRKNIIVNDKYLKIVENIKKKNFLGKKILGVHFRGTSYKRSPNHPFPATKSQIANFVAKLKKENNYDKIFLVSEEENYKRFFKAKFNNDVFFLTSSFRSNRNDAFKIYPRNLHRFKLGREAIIETLLLSNADGLVYITSNIASAAITWNLNKNQKRYKIDNGFNSNNIIISQFLWYLKKILPSYLGGFKKLI